MAIADVQAFSDFVGGGGSCGAVPDSFRGDAGFAGATRDVGPSGAGAVLARNRRNFLNSCSYGSLYGVNVPGF